MDMFAVFVDLQGNERLIMETIIGNLRRTFFLLLLIYFAGCATLFKGSKKNIVFTVSGSEDADISVYELTPNSEKKIGTGKSGVQYELKTGTGYFQKARYKVEATKGTKKTEKFLETKLNLLWYLGGNVALAGPASGMVGYLIVDPLTGAMWDFDLEGKDQVDLYLEKEPIPGASKPTGPICDFFNQTVTLKNKEILKNVVMGIVQGYVVAFTREGKTWVYPKSEVKSAENSVSSEEKEAPETTQKSCDFFTQTVSLKKGESINDTLTAVTSEFVVVLQKDGKVLVYPKKEVMNIENQ
jgi:hypothetical protein